MYWYQRSKGEITDTQLLDFIYLSMLIYRPDLFDIDRQKRRTIIVYCVLQPYNSIATGYYCCLFPEMAHVDDVSVVGIAVIQDFLTKLIRTCLLSCAQQYGKFSVC